MVQLFSNYEINCLRFSRRRDLRKKAQVVLQELEVDGVHFDLSSQRLRTVPTATLIMI